jgi:hypothetical protein
VNDINLSVADSDHLVADPDINIYIVKDAKLRAELDMYFAQNHLYTNWLPDFPGKNTADLLLYTKHDSLP